MSDHEDTPSIENAHFDFIQAESFESDSERRWLAWVGRAKKLAGHSLDGDQETDGYSLDGAYDAFMAGKSVEAYIAPIVAAR